MALRPSGSRPRWIRRFWRLNLWTNTSPLHFFIACAWAGRTPFGSGSARLAWQLCRAPSVMFNYLENYNTQGTNIDYVFFDCRIFISCSVYINYIPVFSNVPTLYTCMSMYSYCCLCILRRGYPDWRFSVLFPQL